MAGPWKKDMSLPTTIYAYPRTHSILELSVIYLLRMR
jgi:hypothetical protein